ncbi:protein kinase domain-containing protein [Actinomycetospora sp. TBRC 11914]|uniref:protein kinase domain-containing protein n=1 Tax=Actinomycetospora sp. TBRC 11914 TaxID=2729387 RepID=UPI00145E6A23|nr:protein kinase [Actinomycetospora sp. TBRC 11914]NMO90372.1 protein kinase [Actinomycetospora sp. TBRC 11914]
MTEQFGPYRVGVRLGRGGMGEVHEAFDTVRERTVALKRLLAGDQDDPDVRERFRRESRIAARLDSPHVVPIHDFGVIDDRMFIDMRLVRGRDLGSLLSAEGPLSAERAVAIVEQVADALDAAHEAGIVHRDVKPSNVLLAARDFVYLADFGIVHVRAATDQPRLTATGSSLGTPAYMAPEQLRAEPFDQRLDVYALGCVLFETLTGRAPFVGERMAIMLSHLNDDPPRPSSFAPAVPSELDEVVLRALSKEPARRQGSAGELAGDARSVLERLASSTEARTYDVHTMPGRPAEPRAAAVGAPRRPAPPVRMPPPAGAPAQGPDAARRAPWAPRPVPGDRTGAPSPAPGSLPPGIPQPRAGSGPVVPPPTPRPADRGRLGLVALVHAVLVAPVGLALGVVARRRGDRRGTVAIVLGAVLTVAAVGAGYVLLRTPVVSASAVAGQIVAQSGLAPGQVTCPDSLPARVGASVVCTATGGGGTQSLRATVTSVSGNQVRFDIVAQ